MLRLSAEILYAMVWFMTPLGSGPQSTFEAIPHFQCQDIYNGLAFVPATGCEPLDLGL